VGVGGGGAGNKRVEVGGQPRQKLARHTLVAHAYYPSAQKVEVGGGSLSQQS
jgi:hypothetical protein